MNQPDPHDNSAEHEYDGIIEQNNPMPSWWIYLFYASIIFACIYMAYYGGKESVLKHSYPHLGANAWSLNKLMIDNVASNSSALSLGNMSADSLENYLGQNGAILKGKKLFEQNCVACHGQNGEGIIAPNLTDAHWLHGGSPQDILKTIQEGVPEKGMIAWKSVLGNKSTIELTAYIDSIRNTNSPSARGPEGELWKP